MFISICSGADSCNSVLQQAWRLLTRSYMPGGGHATSSTPLLAYSPMFHSRLFAEHDKYRAAHFEPVRKLPNFPAQRRDGDHEQAAFDSPPSERKPPYLDGNPTTDRPLIVQFCSNSPDDFLPAAQLVAPHCDAVDLNLGCPQGIARKGRYGAFLQEDWSLIHNLISTLHHNLSIPVTAKIRILETRERTLEYARMILDAGASILTVHGRRREQKGHLTGLAEWDVIRYLRENLPRETVIFANGNVLAYEDVERCLDRTGADAVMSAEGNLHDPTIFRGPPRGDDEDKELEREYWRGRDGKMGGYRMDAVLRRYLDIIYQHVLGREPPKRRPLFSLSSSSTPSSSSTNHNQHDITTEIKSTTPPASDPDSKLGHNSIPKPESRISNKKRQRNRITSPNFIAMQPHLFNLLRPLLSRQTHIRSVLAKVPMGDMTTYERILEMVEDVTAEGMRAYADGIDDGMEHCAKKVDEMRRREMQGEEIQTVDGINGQMEGLIRNNDNCNGNSVKIPQFNSVEATTAHYKRPWWVCQPYIRPLPAEAVAIGAVTVASKTARAKNKSNSQIMSKNDNKENNSGNGMAQIRTTDRKRSLEEPKEEDVNVDTRETENGSKRRKSGAGSMEEQGGSAGPEGPDAGNSDLGCEAHVEDAVKGARGPEESEVTIEAIGADGSGGKRGEGKEGGIVDDARRNVIENENKNENEDGNGTMRVRSDSVVDVDVDADADVDVDVDAYAAGYDAVADIVAANAGSAINATSTTAIDSSNSKNTYSAIAPPRARSWSHEVEEDGVIYG